MYAILIPVYNDEESLVRLIEALDVLLEDVSFALDIILVNDGGASFAPYVQTPKKISEIHEIQLAVNLGHQRAIAVGLTELAIIDRYEAVVIMDGDGEDKPSDAIRLLEHHIDHPEAVVVASRTKRSEAFQFRLFYRIYQLIFKTMTGKKIDFGNFMLLPNHVVSSIVYNANLWNHLAATILSSKYTLHRLESTRGERYKGKSQMNFEQLVTHGLSAMSVNLVTIFTRIITALSGMLFLALSAIGVVVGIRYLTDLAIPGWATNLVGILLVIILQLIILILVSMFATLNQRAILTGMPLSYTQDYIKEKRILFQGLS
jgi:glycosyltransferase involved in cell wall biosynthesis